MKNTNIITAFLFLLLYACIEDKGNYTYMSVDDIVIRYPNENTIKVNTNEPLKIGSVYERKSEMAIEQNEVEIEWKIGNNVVGKDSVLQIPNVDLPIGSYMAMITVLDKSTNIKYVRTFRIQVESKYAHGWLVLYNDGSISRLAYLKEYEEFDFDKFEYVTKWIIDDSVYYRLNGAQLPLNCKKLADHGYKPDKFKGGGVTVIHDGPDGGIELNGYSLTKDYTVRELFMEEVLPTGFELKDILYTGTGIVALGENGRVYSGRYTDKTFYNSRLTHLESRYNNKPLCVDHFIPTEYYQESNVWLMYDKEQREFISVYDDDSEIEGSSWSPDPSLWKSGTYMSNRYYGELKGEYARFVSLDHMTMEVVASGYVNTGEHNASYMLVLRDQQGDYFLQKHHDELNRYIPKTVVEPIFHKRISCFKQLLNEGSQIVINALTPNEIYFSGGGRIYVVATGYASQGDATPYLVDDSYRDKVVTSMEFNNQADRLAVGFSDGTIVIYKKPDLSEVMQADFKPEKLLDEKKFGKKITDVIFKNGAPVQGRNAENGD